MQFRLVTISGLMAISLLAFQPQKGKSSFPVLRYPVERLHATRILTRWYT